MRTETVLKDLSGRKRRFRFATPTRVEGIREKSLERERPVIPDSPAPVLICRSVLIPKKLALAMHATPGVPWNQIAEAAFRAELERVQAAWKAVAHAE